MLVVVPVSKHDWVLAEPFCNIVSFFAPYKNHSLLVLSNPSDKQYADYIFDRISSYFLKSDIYIFDKDAPTGWPLGPNFYWKQCISYLININNTTPWYWMELDSTPITNNWLDLVDGEYESCNKPFMGMIQKPIDRFDGPPYLVGSSIYPANISLFYNSWHEVEHIKVPFDVACSDHVINLCHESKLMKNCFRVSDFRCTNNGIRGKTMKASYCRFKYDSIIEDNVAVVHGCVDGTLAKLLLGKLEK